MIHDIAQYTNRTFEVTSGSWIDESELNDNLCICKGTYLRVIGWLTARKDRFVWHLVKPVYGSPSDPPLSLGGLCRGTVVHLLLGVVKHDMSQPVFCCRPYDEMKLTRIDGETPPSMAVVKREINHFPSKCPKCGASAYIGFSSFVCSNRCNPTLK